MNNSKFLQKLIGMMLAIVLLAGCSAPAATPTLSPTFPPPPLPPQPEQPPQPGQPQPGQPPSPTFAPPLTSAPPAVSTGGSLFKLVKEVKVTPTGNFPTADFVRIGYVPGRDRFIVTFGSMLSQPEGDCSNVGYGWVEYTTDMAPTGNQGLVNCEGGTGDSSGLFVGDDFYLAVANCQVPGPAECAQDGWQLFKYSAVTWEKLVNKTYSLASGEGAGDPTVAFVNGQIDISDTYAGPGSHHNFFTTDLQFVSKRLLSDTQNNGFSSMITQGGITYFLSSAVNVESWSVIVMQYDPSWTYLGVKTLREHAATPQGLAFDGNRFYVAYIERTDGFPFASNVHLAAFDTSWNLVDDIALTSFTLQEQTNSMHPGLALKDNRLYVSYSQNAPAGGLETLQAYVKVYELSQNP